MALTTSSARLFGLDLAPAWRSLCLVWRNWPQWPLLRSLTPSTTVLLIQADGQHSLWRDEVQLKTQASAKDLKSARFVAVEVPDAISLHRRIALPALDEPERTEAVALEAQSANPFAADDLVWGYRVAPDRTGPRLHADLALTSRKQLSAHMASLALPTPSTEVEAWVLDPGRHPIVLTGYGERRRLLQTQRWRNIGLGLLLLALGVAAAIAVTPTAQLRLRALEASAAFEEARTATAPLARQREALVQTSERLQTLAQLLNNQPQPMQVLNRVTQMLPDDTWLQSLAIQGTKISINGQTTDAAALMQDLGKRDGVQSVHAPSAAVRVAGANRETFAIEFVLDRVPLPATSARPTEVGGTPSTAAAPLQSIPAAPSTAAAQPAPASTSSASATATPDRSIAAGLPTAPSPAAPTSTMTSAPVATPMAAPVPAAAPTAAPAPIPKPAATPPATQPGKANPFGMVGG